MYATGNAPGSLILPVRRVATGAAERDLEHRRKVRAEIQAAAPKWRLRNKFRKTGPPSRVQVEADEMDRGRLRGQQIAAASSRRPA